MAGSRDCSKAAVARSLLQVERLTKRFGGVVTADALSFDIPAGECHAIIGPNGAGKTTLIGLLAGEISAHGGTISFDGADITPLPPYRRSLAGIARSFQISSLFPDFSALDNVALAVQAHRGHSFHFWRNARHDERLRGPALKALARVALAGRADGRVGRVLGGGVGPTPSMGSLRSPAHWQHTGGFCSWTSRWPAWGPRNRPPCSN